MDNSACWFKKVCIKSSVFEAWSKKKKILWGQNCHSVKERKIRAETIKKAFHACATVS